MFFRMSELGNISLLVPMVGSSRMVHAWALLWGPCPFLLALARLLLCASLLESSDATCNTAGRCAEQLFILEGKNESDSFSKLPFFSRLNYFCCQTMHSTFYLLPLFYVFNFYFFFLQLLESETKILLFSEWRRVQVWMITSVYHSLTSLRHLCYLLSPGNPWGNSLG